MTNPPTTHAVAPSLLRMTWPVVVSFTLRQAFSTVDLVYASYLDDQAAVAAIGFWIPFQEIYIALWVGLSAGFTAALAYAFGRRDATRAGELKRAAIRIQLVVVIALELGAIIAWLTMPSWGLPPGLARSFRIYGTVLMVGLPLTGFWSIWPDSIVKAHYDMRATMLAGIWATAANVALNTVFVFVFGWGLFGIALATVLSRVVALVYSLRRASHHEERRAVEPGWSHAPSPERSKASLAILRLGVPAALAFGLAATESGLVNTLLVDLPNATESIASWGVMIVLLRLALMPASATSVAVVPFVARLAAQGESARVQRELTHAVLLALGFGFLFTVPAGVIFPDTIGAFFLRGDAREALAGTQTQALLRLLPFAGIAITPFLVVRPTFEAVQRPRLGVLVAIGRYALLSWPLVFAGRALAPALGVTAVTGMALGMIAAAGLASIGTVLLAGRELRRVAARSA